MESKSRPALYDPLTRQMYEITKPITTLGRAKSNDVMVLAPCVSRSHAMVLNTDDGCFLVDCGSINGTMLNGRRVHFSRLHAGDEVMIGGFAYSFCYVAAEGRKWA